MLDADLVPALTVVRSLLKQLYQVDVASAVPAPIAAFSRGVSRCLQYPDPLRDEEAFLAWLEDHLNNNHYDLVIPVTERTLVPLSSRRNRFAAARIAMADAGSLDRVLDKTETFRLAESLGVAVPHSVYLTDLEELAEYGPQLSYPVVVKPSHSVSEAAGGYRKRSVSYASTASQLYRQCEQSLRHSPVILQSYFQGQGAGIELIARDGEILYAFQHLRLHEVPLTGGGSSFRVSTPIEPQLLAASQKLMRALCWTGVAMVEFKWDPVRRSACLMEINGRLWGSLPLAVAAGADFPAMLAELSITGTLGAYPAYRSGVYCRNLVSDLMWHEMVLRSRGGEHTGPAQVPTTRVMVRDLGRMFSPRHHFDTQSLSDPRPGLVEIRRLLASYGGRLADLIAARRCAVHQRWLWRSGAVARRFRAARSVLFICYGNINRSALAAVILETTLPADTDKVVRSAGFHKETGRPADERMRSIGVESGFDLSGCRSTCVTRELIRESDIIFVMERKHRDYLRSDYPMAGDKTFLLGPGSCEAGRGITEIPDPYNQSEDVYRACFAQIHQAVARLIEARPVR